MPVKIDSYAFESCNDIPDTIEDGKIYVWGRNFAYLKCPCGCGKQVILTIHGSEHPRWQVAGKTITPSIRMKVDCQSHYSIINGKVKWH